MPRIPFISISAAAVATVACSGSPRPSTSAGSARTVTTADITAADLRHRLFLVTDDSTLGRDTGSEGDFKTTQYIADEFKRLGLEPAGDNGTYFQTIPFWLAAVDPTSTLTAGANTLTVGRDFLPNALGAPASVLNNVATIYGGSLVDTTQWISPTQAAGKVVILDLPGATGFRGAPMGRWAGAVAVAFVTLDGAAPEQIARLVNGRAVPDNERNPRVTPTLLISRNAAARILGAAPATLKPGTAGSPLNGHFDIARSAIKFPVRNVVGILRGSDPKLNKQYLSLTAHHDHVGFDHAPVDHDSLRAVNTVVRPMGADSPARQPTAAEWQRIRTILADLRKVNKPRLDSIRNGADDDGSGTVSLLEIAEAMSRGKRPARSVIFVSHAAEEVGLLGSKWFTDHATVPTDSIVAEIDQDMVGRGTANDYPRGGTGAGSPTYLEVIGAKRLSKEFGDSLEAANARQPVPFVFDYTYDAPGHPLQYYCRADHYSYARYGIPAVAFSRGEHMDYHQVTDEAQYISYPDLLRVSKMVFDAAMAIGNMPVRPKLSVPKPANPNVQCRQ